MTQLTIVTTPPNSGDGTPLATAFNYCNSNFSELYARYQVSPPVSLTGTTGDVAGMYANDSTYFYYCFADYDGSSTIWAQVTQVGNISLSRIENGTSNVQISTAGGNATVTVGGVPNVVVTSIAGQYVTGILSATGNVVGNYFVGNGSQLTGITAYTNANVQAFLPTYTGTLSPSAIYTNGYFYANGSPFAGGGSGSYGNTEVAAFLPTYTGNLGGTLTTAAQPRITAVGNLSALTVNGVGNVTLTPASGNITLSPTFGGHVIIDSADTGSLDNMIIGNGTPQVGKFTQLSASGNITGQYILGDGSQLTGIPTSYSNANVAAYLPTYSGNLGGTLTTAAQTNITAVGTLSGLTVNGVGTFTQLSATGNITGQYILGNGSLLTGLTTSYSNANVAAYLPTYTGNLSGGNLTLTGNANVGIVNGQVNGLINNINTVYGTWDFGYIAANTYTNPIQWIFAQTSAGNLDMGTVLSPASYAIDIGTIF